MPRGCPYKRRFIDNLRLTQSREHENELTNVRDNLSQNNPNYITHENQVSTSKPLPFPVVIEARNQVQYLIVVLTILFMKISHQLHNLCEVLRMIVRIDYGKY